MIITQTNTVATTITSSSAGKISASVTPSLKTDAVASISATFYDSDVLENESAEAWSEYEIQLPLGLDYAVESLSSCQSLTGSSIIPVGDGGFGRVRVTFGAISKIIKCDTTKRIGQTVREFVEYTAGSISRHLYDQVAPLFDATPDVNYFSTYDHATSTYTRNSSCWGSIFDLSCVAVASNSGSGWSRQRGGTLISPRHVLIARHFPLEVGSHLRFVNASGTVETRTVIGTSSAARAGDFLVCSLSDAVTVATPCPVAGQWLTQGRAVVDNYASWYSGGVAIHVDQNARLYAGTIGQTTSQVGSLSTTWTVGEMEFPYCDAVGCVDHWSGGAVNLPAMRKIPVTGDSGQPCFIVIGGSPVLLWVWHIQRGGPPTYMHNGAVLDALITVSDADAGISTGLTVTVATDPTL